MAHAAAVASTVDHPDPAAAGASVVSALSKITIASPLVLPVSSSATGAQPSTAAIARPNSSDPAVVLCQLEQSLGAISIQSAGSAAPHVTCSVSCALQPTPASSQSSSQPTLAAGTRAHTTLLTADRLQLQSSAASGNSMAQPVPSREMDSDGEGQDYG